MLAAMARGDESKTTTKANYACKQFEVAMPIKKPAALASTSSSSVRYHQQTKKPEVKKDYGAWGSVYKDKKTFLDMHFC